MLKWLCFKVWIVRELDCITSKSNKSREGFIWRRWRLLSLHIVCGQVIKTWLWNILFYGNDGENKYTEENRSQRYFVRHKSNTDWRVIESGPPAR